MTVEVPSPDGQMSPNEYHSSPSRAGRPPRRMLELQAILEAGNTDKDQIAEMMHISRKVFNVYLERLERRRDKDAEDLHADCLNDHVIAKDGEVVCTWGGHGEVIGYTQVQPEHKLGEQISFVNRAHWGNGLGSPKPAAKMRSYQYFNKALLEKGGYEVLLIKQFVCDALDTPNTEFGNLISNRAAELAETELKKRRVDRLIDKHECILIVKQALRQLVKETPISAKYVNKERLRLVTKEADNKIDVLDNGEQK